MDLTKKDILMLEEGVIPAYLQGYSKDQIIRELAIKVLEQNDSISEALDYCHREELDFATDTLEEAELID